VPPEPVSDVDRGSAAHHGLCTAFRKKVSSTHWTIRLPRIPPSAPQGGSKWKSFTAAAPASTSTRTIQKVLEDANLKLASVISNVVGKSGRAILTAVIAGETDPRKLARLAQGVKASEDRLTEALRGHVTEHHRFMLKLYLEQFDALDEAIAASKGMRRQRCAPFEKPPNSS
jgi:hypothetical protein